MRQEEMTLIIGKGSIEEKVKREARERSAIRRQEDVHKGLIRSKEAQRGDFSELRTLDKTLEDYRRFKSPKDREKIKQEYFGRQKEMRKN